MNEKQKENKNADETQKVIIEIFDYNKQIQKAFELVRKFKKPEPELKPEGSIAETVKLRRQKSEESDKESMLENEEIDTTDMPDLESEESATQRSVGLKILTPNQMLSRLAISLALLKAENNSEKLKNEIRQLLYSLYRSNKLKKQLKKF